MQPDQILGEIQAIRAEVERVENREDARKIKARLSELREESLLLQATVTPDDLKRLWRIVDEFTAETKATIVRTFGTSAWDEPESVEEAKARMGTLSAAPGPGVLDRANERVPPPLTDEDLDGLADGRGYHPDPMHNAKVGELVAEVRRLRSDEWLTRAAEEIEDRPRPDDGGPIDHDAEEFRRGRRPARLAALLAILRKHRDGKA